MHRSHSYRMLCPEMESTSDTLYPSRWSPFQIVSLMNHVWGVNLTTMRNLPPHYFDKERVPVPAQVLLTLMKLKSNLSFRSFGSFERSATEIFSHMIGILHTILKHFVTWLPDDINKDNNMPIYFAFFSDTRVAYSIIALRFPFSRQNV